MDASQIKLAELEMIPPMARLVHFLLATPERETVRPLMASLITDQPQPLTDAEQAAAIAPFLWLLERAEAGLALTKAGYMPPADVLALAERLPSMRGWAGKRKREDLNPEVGNFRKMMMELGWVCKDKGRLVLTQAGTDILAHPGQIWGRLGASLLDSAQPGKVHLDVWVLVLMYLAAGQWPDDEKVGRMLGAAGWSNPDGSPPSEATVREVARTVYAITDNLGAGGLVRRDKPVSSVVRRFAWQTLVRVVPLGDDSRRQAILADMVRGGQESGVLGVEADGGE